MSASFRAVALSLLIPVAASAAVIRGVVVTPNGQPLSGAVVSAGEVTAQTAEDGSFSMDVPAGARLRVARDGFQPQVIDSAASLRITLRPVLAENIVVSGIRAEAETPVTKSDLRRDEIAQSYHGQDIPLLLRDTPSISAYAEGGVGGAGYSYITLRGISPTRLNFTFDGIPLADPEDMGTYFVDFPDLAHSIESIQVQRGVGTSTVGSPSFGGSINLESIALTQEDSTHVWLGGGSFGTRLSSVGHQTGELPGGFAAYGRLSVQQTDGFREHSGVQQHSVFLSVAKQGPDSQLKLTGFAGHEKQQESFLASDEATLQQNLRDNPLSPDVRDSFGYNLGEIQYLRALSPSANMTASVFFQRGAGWYRLHDADESLRQYNLDGLLLGGMVTYSTSVRGVSANYGVHINHFRREHARDLVGGPRDYSNSGTKDEANAFAKYTFELNRWRLYADGQLRSTAFSYHGDVRLDSMRWTFFNPKLGARYELTSNSGAYVSAGMSRREPTRNDLFQGEDNPTVAHDLRAVRPERLVDFEAGWDYRGARASIAANVYAMEFRNEIAATGQLSDIGLALRRNVDRSYRRGIEVEETLQITPAIRIRGNLSVSRNRIREWTQYFDVYDAAGAFVDSRPVTYSDVAPLLSPSLIVNQSIDYAPARRVTLSVTGRYVGRSYLDNTNSDAFTAPAFFVADSTAAVQFTRSAKLTLQINNLFNRRRVFPSGYSYQFMTPAGIDGIRYFYPQAGRNAVVTLDVNL